MDKSKMQFVLDGEEYRLRFSYSPDDSVVTRCTIEKRSDGIWGSIAYAQVYREGGAVRWKDRERALNKLLYAASPAPRGCGLDYYFSRQFRAAAWKAYWERGEYTAPAQY